MKKEINKLQTNVGAILIARKNQNKFRTKKQNNNAHVGAGPVSAHAITLIALIITIIILLILAGVTISLMLGDEGILNIAQTSIEKQKMAEYQEKIELSRSKALTSKKGTITIDDLINKIYEDKIVQEGNIKKIDEEKANLITNEGHEFIITTSKMEYIGINNGPKINTINITPYGFVIEVKQNYPDNFVKEYKYYLNEELIYSGTSESIYSVTGLDEGTKYNVYAEICTKDEIIKTSVVEVTTQTVNNGIKLNGNTEIVTNLAQSDILKTANNQCTIAMRVKINRQEQATMNYMGLWGYHEAARWNSLPIY